MTKKTIASSGRGGPPNPIDIHIGDRIRAKRRLVGIGQQEFAKALGVTFQQVQKYEKGFNRISGSRLYDIAAVLGTDINFYFQDMPAGVGEASPRQLAGIKSSSKSLKDSASADSQYGDMSTTRSMTLLRNFNNIPQQELQDNIFELCGVLSKENVGRKRKKKD